MSKTYALEKVLETFEGHLVRLRINDRVEKVCLWVKYYVDKDAIVVGVPYNGTRPMVFRLNDVSRWAVTSANVERHDAVVLEVYING